LRDLTRAEALRGSPLLRSRLLMDVAASANDLTRVQALRDQLMQIINTLQSSPREAKLYRAIYHTYVQPAATQEQAAELLDLPFSTYRRHLQSGIVRITEILWQRELGGV
jgi:DNA-directed RNA polymerase specialized sigma24 family protein